MTDNPNNSPLISQVMRLRAAQAKQEAAELTRLVNAYAAIHERAQRNAELLQAELERMEPPITPSKVRRLQRYKRIMEDAEDELQRYETFMEVELRTAGRASIASGEADARILAQVALGDIGDRAELRALNPAVIEELVGFLDPRGPLYRRLSMLPKWTAEQLAEAILTGVGLGQNPRTIAREITKAMGMGLTESMRMMRTVQLWSYREANRASYLANADVVRGWIWYAELDGSTCASCIAMHGTRHGLGETLNDHHNGRCSMIPDVGVPVQITPGSQWFDGLSIEQQKATLGASKWHAWKDGKFTLADIVGINTDEVYGDMRMERSLKDLLGE